MPILLIVIYIVFISLGLPDSLFGTVWPVVHADFGLPISFASIFMIIVAVSTGGVSFVAGRIIRKYGTGKVTFISIILTIIGMIGISFSPNIWIMICFSIVLGLGGGAIDTGLNSYVSLHYEAKHMNWLHCFWGIGVTASPLIMSSFLIGGQGAWRNGYRIIAAIQISIALLVFITRKRWADISESSMATSLTDEDIDCASVDKNDVIDDLGDNKPHIFKMPGFVYSVLSLGAYCGMEFMLGTWGATYLVNTMSLSPDKAALWISLYYGGILLGRFIAGLISSKLNDNQMIKYGTLISLLGIIILTLPLGLLSLCGLLLIGLGFGPIFPSTLHAIPERFGKKYAADLTGYHMGTAYALSFLLQLIFGYIAAATTFKITPYVLLLLCILLFIFYTLTVRKCKKIKMS